MWYPFILQNLHFALNVFGSLVMFSIAWLYFDATKGRKTVKDILKIFGFLLLAFSFFLCSLVIETSFLLNPIVPKNVVDFISGILKNLGFFLILVGLIADPLQKKPKTSEEELNKQNSKLGLDQRITTTHNLANSLLPFSAIYFSVPLSLLVTLFYFIKFTKGLERHLKQPFLGFFVLSISELLSIPYILRNSQDVTLYDLVAPFGLLWVLQNFFLTISFLILGRWVFSYLLRRFETQLLIISVSAILFIFVLTAISYSTLLFKNIENETLARLEIDSRVLSYVLETKKLQVLTDAEFLAQNEKVVIATKTLDKKMLAELSEIFLLNKSQNSLLLVDSSGQVLARGEETERIGESLSNDPLVKRVLLGEGVTSLTVRNAVPAQVISIKGAYPIKLENNIIGAVVSGVNIDNAFVDGIKTSTGLDSAVYGGEKLSASTISSPSGSRSIGITEVNQNVVASVLGRGKNFKGTIKFLSVPYYASYQPIRDVDNNIIGMLFVGRRQLETFQAAGKSIEETFVMTAALMLLSLIPTYLISKYIVYQIK
ncbi:MAG: cache domain-containing protein [Patescibacteria group bacterium]